MQQQSNNGSSHEGNGGRGYVRSILRGLGSRTLACGCVVGLYETYDSQAIAILDVRGTGCRNPRHRLNIEVPIDEPAKAPSVGRSTKNG